MTSALCILSFSGIGNNWFCQSRKDSQKNLYLDLPEEILFFFFNSYYLSSFKLTKHYKREYLYIFFSHPLSFHHTKLISEFLFPLTLYLCDRKWFCHQIFQRWQLKKKNWSFFTQNKSNKFPIPTKWVLATNQRKTRLTFWFIAICKKVKSQRTEARNPIPLKHEVVLKWNRPWLASFQDQSSWFSD